MDIEGDGEEDGLNLPGDIEGDGEEDGLSLPGDIEGDGEEDGREYVSHHTILKI